MPQKPKHILPPLPFANIVGDNIAFFRKKKGLTQRELAKIIGIDNSLVSHYECNRLHLNDDMLVRFSLALKVSTDELLGVKPPKTVTKDISLRLIKRMNAIEKLPEVKKKYVLKILDAAIKASKKA